MEDDRTAIMAARALSPGYEILWYTIKQVLGQGGFGITYLAYDRNLDRSVAIKEYLPTPFAYRHRDFSVKPLTGDHRDQFAWGLDGFQREAQTLAKFGHDNIVRVHSVFEQNNTAYMVMEYENGENLASVYKKQRGQFDQSFFQQVFFPIFDGLKEIHKFGFIHRDIKPANIYIRENGSPVLIDFGSARQTSKQQSDEMTALVTQGYTPLEQYSSNYGEQGPWTDIYALAATMYEGIVGKKPEESLGRSARIMKSKPDVITSLKTTDYPAYKQPFLDAVIAGLALEPEHRPSDLNKWLSMFYTDVATTVVPPAQDQMRPSGKHAESSKVVPLRPDSAGSIARSGNKSSPNRRSKPHAESLTKVLQQAHAPSSADSTRVRAAREFELGLDELNFEDDPHDRILAPSQEQSWERQYEEDQHAGSTPKKWISAVAICALLAALATGAWYYTDIFRTPGKVATVDAAVVRSLPTPTTQTGIVLPKELVLQQLTTLQSMAGLYKQASAVDPNNASLLDGIDSAYQRLISIAGRWSASNHPDIAREVQRVRGELPANAAYIEQISEVISQSDKRSDPTAIQQFLLEGTLSVSSGEELVDIIGSLSKADKLKLEQSEEWQNMLQSYRQTAVDKIRALAFTDAAKVIAAGLTLQPGDNELQLLREHLQR